jgi:hypothetical protein
MGGGLGQYASYVNPNAVCPLCRESVFFYQSPNGGRVFFDELGPPWPKHRCFYFEHVFAHPKETPENPPIRAAWLRKGWQPFQVIDLACNKGEHGRRLSGRLLRHYGDIGTFCFFDIESEIPSAFSEHCTLIPVFVRATAPDKRQIQIAAVEVPILGYEIESIYLTATFPPDCSKEAVAALRVTPARDRPQ